MQYKTRDKEEYEGVGMIWKGEGGWYFRTIYGDEGGPLEKYQAETRMECCWATKTMVNGGVIDPPRHRMTQTEKKDRANLWLAQENLLRVAWR